MKLQEKLHITFTVHQEFFRQFDFLSQLLLYLRLISVSSYQGGREHWIIEYICTQSFINTFYYSLALILFELLNLVKNGWLKLAVFWTFNQLFWYVKEVIMLKKCMNLPPTIVLSLFVADFIHFVVGLDLHKKTIE